MRNLLVASALVLASAAPSAAQKVYVDYDGATAFSQFRTFQYVEAREDLRDTNPFLHEHIVESLKQYLVDGGLTETADEPEAFVSYYAADQGDLRLVLSDLDYAYGSEFQPGAYWKGGVGTRTPDSFTFKEGTLIIDVWEAATKRLIWRGMATATVSSDPGRNSKKVDRALAEMIKQWEKAYGGHVRELRKYQESKGSNR